MSCVLSFRVVVGSFRSPVQDHFLFFVSRSRALRRIFKFDNDTWGFPKIRGTFLGVPRIGIVVFLRSILGSPYLGKLPHLCAPTATEDARDSEQDLCKVLMWYCYDCTACKPENLIFPNGAP